MRIPKELIVGVMKWRVKRVSSENANGRCGVSYAQLKEINIDTSLEEKTAEETFTHELLHACASFAEIHDGEKLTEEEFISRISPVLYMVIEQNKGIFK